MSNPTVRNLEEWLPHRSRSTPPTMIVMHATAGANVQGALDTLRDRGLSYHYIIAPTGEITKCCPLNAVAFHAGNSYGPKEAAVGVSRAQNHAKEFTAKPTPCVNGYTVGIAFVNKDDGHDTYDLAQVESAKWLVGQIRKMFSGVTHVTSHAIVSPGRKIDPLGFPIDDFALDVGLKVWRP